MIISVFYSPRAHWNAYQKNDVSTRHGTPGLGGHRDYASGILNLFSTMTPVTDDIDVTLHFPGHAQV